jgi:hypothetical protein
MKSGQSREIEEIFLKQPKIWILTYRTDKLKQILNPYFNNSYLRIFPNILVSGTRVTISDDTKFINSWYGKYRLFSPEGQPIKGHYSVNGQTTSGNTTIMLGENLIKLEAPYPRAYLLPSDISVPFKITTNMKQIPLFENVYSY